MNVMEDKELNEKESLELITRMIQNTKFNFMMIIPGHYLNRVAKDINKKGR